MLIKILECQNCKKKHILAEYEAVYNHQISGSEYDNDHNPGIIEPYRMLICPSCKHANYTDNVMGALKYTVTDMPNYIINEALSGVLK